MFKSIEYRLITYLGLLLVSAVSTTYFFIHGHYLYAVCLLIACAWFVLRLVKHYNRFNRNILFLLNAIENGDYSFHFSVTSMSRREKELNSLLNRIKEILSKARTEVMENEKFLSLIMESASTGIIIAGQSHGVDNANAAARQMLGLPVFTHLNQLDNAKPGLAKSIKELNPGESVQVKVFNEREENLISAQVSQLTIRNKVLRVITLNNIGNEIEATEMESWIKLIRVMTHEIMNSIAPITSLSDTMLSLYGNDPAGNTSDNLRLNTIEALTTINTTARGLITFVESYRKFTGIPQPRLEKADPNGLIESAVLLTRTFADQRGVAIVTDGLNDGGDHITADRDQVIQVLINILKNAIESCVKGNTINIRTLRTGPELHIEILNDGTPIPADVLPHIFVPFFTTKEHGSGIGLSLSRYIMRLHGGNLKHRYEDGKTIFTLTFK